MLTEQKLMDAMIECRRFMKAAAKARNVLRKDRMARINGSPETATARRSSMDLTRSLARLRSRD